MQLLGDLPRNVQLRVDLPIFGQHRLSVGYGRFRLPLPAFGYAVVVVIEVTLRLRVDVGDDLVEETRTTDERIRRSLHAESIDGYVCRTG